MPNKLAKFMLGFAFMVLIFNPIFVYAQQTTSLPQYAGGVDQSISDYLCTPSEPADGHDLERCVNRIYRFGITAGAIVVVFFIVVAGYEYITGGEVGKTKGKQMLFNALTGLGILLTSYTLLYFINPSLVVIKPIQPPIFEAGEIPTCDELGLSKNNDCSIFAGEGEQEDRETANATAGGSYAECVGGVVPITGIPRVGSGSQMCKELMTKMQAVLDQFKAKQPGFYFGISSTIRNTKAESRCHYAGNAVSGNCADTVLRTTAGAKVPGNNAAWGELCRLLVGAGLSLANETGSAHQGCPNPKTYKYTSGPHFHVYVPAK